MGDRYVSPYAALRLILRGQKIEHLADGNYRELEHGLYAQFLPQEYTDREREVAYERFGAQIQRGSRFADETLTVPATQDWRIGTFDTAWIGDPEDRVEIERLMKEHRKNGLDFIQVQIVKLKAPWPNYDKIVVSGRRTMDHVVQQIMERVNDLGIDRSSVIAYEQENLNRPEVITGLLGAPAEERIEVLA